MLKTIILFPFIWYGLAYALMYFFNSPQILTVIGSGVVSYFIAEAIIKRIFNKSKTSLKTEEKDTVGAGENQSTDVLSEEGVSKIEPPKEEKDLCAEELTKNEEDIKSTTMQENSQSKNNMEIGDYTLIRLVDDIENNDISKVKEVIEYGKIDINELLIPYKGYHNGTALYAAVQVGNPEIVHYLLSKGADPNLGIFQPMHSETPLKAAMCWAPNRGSKNPYDYIKIVNLLVNAGADVNSENDTDSPLLLLAVERYGEDYPELIQILIEGGIDLESGHQGFRALEYMAIHNHYKSIPVLVKARDRNPVNDYSSEGITALHQAAYCGNRDAIVALVKSGADIFIEDNNGNTAASLAKQQGHEALYMFFEEYANLKVNNTL